MNSVKHCKAKVSKIGGTASKDSKKVLVQLPAEYARELEITEESRDIEISCDGKQIVIKKA